MRQSCRPITARDAAGWAPKHHRLQTICMVKTITLKGDRSLTEEKKSRRSCCDGKHRRGAPGGARGGRRARENLGPGKRWFPFHTPGRRAPPGRAAAGLCLREHMSPCVCCPCAEACRAEAASRRTRRHRGVPRGAQDLPYMASTVYKAMCSCKCTTCP